MYKHWDEWVETIPHPFVAPFNGNEMGEATDILVGEPYESPMKPFGGIEQLAWSPDSKKIAYTCRKRQEKHMLSLPTQTFISMTQKVKLPRISAKITPNGSTLTACLI